MSQIEFPDTPNEFPTTPEEYPESPQPLEPSYPGIPEPEPSQTPEPNL